MNQFRAMVLLVASSLAAACTSAPPATLPASSSPATIAPGLTTVAVPTPSIVPTDVPHLLAGAPRLLAWKFAAGVPTGSAVTVFALGLPASGTALVEIDRATIPLDDPTSKIETVSMSGESSGDVLVSLNVISADGQSSGEHTFRWLPGTDPHRSPELDSFWAGGQSSPDGRFWVEMAYVAMPSPSGQPYVVQSTSAHVLDTSSGTTADYVLPLGPWDPALSDSGLAAPWSDATHMLIEKCEANASEALRECAGKTPSFRSLDVTDGTTAPVSYPTGPRTLSRLRSLWTDDGYQFFEAGLGYLQPPVLSLKLLPYPVGSSGSRGIEGLPTEAIVGRDLFVQVEDRIFRITDPVGRARNGRLTTAPELMLDNVANPQTLTSGHYAADLTGGVYVILANAVAILGRPGTYPFAFEPFQVTWWRVAGAALPHG
jgi:hypothetical protein